MEKLNIKARIKRNNLDKLTDKYYQDEDSDFIKYLNSINKKALVGILRDDGLYTVIGCECIYYSTITGVNAEIPHSLFLEILKDNALNQGKNGQFEFIHINEQDSIWLMNAQTMNAIWNTVLFVSKV